MTNKSHGSSNRPSAGFADFDDRISKNISSNDYYSVDMPLGSKMAGQAGYKDAPNSAARVHLLEDAEMPITRTRFSMRFLRAAKRNPLSY